MTESQVKETIVPMFFKYCHEKVASVREAASQSFGLIITKFKDNDDEVADILTHVIDEFAQCGTYTGRMAFVHMCKSLMACDTDLFSKTLKSQFVKLKDDRVVLIRVAVARVLNEFMS